MYKSIGDIYVQGGQTTLLDAIYFMTEKLNAKVNADKSAFAGKVIVVITDGEDRVSLVTETSLTKLLRESGVKVYAVGLVNDLESGRRVSGKSPRDKAVDFLNRFTKETGGAVIYPTSGIPDVDALLAQLLK